MADRPLKLGTYYIRHSTWYDSSLEVEDEKEIVVGDIATVTVQLLCAS